MKDKITEIVLIESVYRTCATKRGESWGTTWTGTFWGELADCVLVSKTEPVGLRFCKLKWYKLRQTRAEQTQWNLTQWAKSSKHRKWLLKMKITGFLGQVRINISAFALQPEKCLAWKKWEEVGKEFQFDLKLSSLSDWIFFHGLSKRERRPDWVGVPFPWAGPCGSRISWALFKTTLRSRFLEWAQ